MEAIEEEASQVVIGNCSLQSSMPPTGSPSGPTNPITVGAVERISNGVEFALHFTSPAGVTVSCSGASTESTLDAQLQDIFEESFVVDQLQAVLSNGTITLRSLTTTAATTTEGESDKGLSTGAIVGIAVGGGVAAFILIIIIAVIISYGWSVVHTKVLVLFSDISPLKSVNVCASSSGESCLFLPSLLSSPEVTTNPFFVPLYYGTDKLC